MSYEKQNFVNGQVLKAEHLNHIEDGIKWIEDTVNNYSGSSDSVLFTEQSLTDEQKEIARNNINAISETTFKGLSTAMQTYSNKSLSADLPYLIGKVLKNEDVVHIGDICAIHVSDKTPTISDFNCGFAITVSYETTEGTITSEGIMISPDIVNEFVSDMGNGLLVIGLYLFVIPYDNCSIDGMVFPNKGVYFMYNGGTCCTGLSLGDYDFSDNGSLPKDFFEGEGEGTSSNTLTWDGDTTGLEGIVLEDAYTLYKIPNVKHNVTSVEDFSGGYTLVLNDGTKLEQSSDTYSNGLSLIENNELLGTGILGGEAGFFKNNGEVYLLNATSPQTGEELFVSSFTINNKLDAFSYYSQKINPVYLPESKNTWNDIKDKPFETMDDVVAAVIAALPAAEGVSF